MGVRNDLQGTQSYGLHHRGGELMEDLINEEILETIYEEVQEDFPNLSTKEWEDMAIHRFTEGG